MCLIAGTTASESSMWRTQIMSLEAALAALSETVQRNNALRNNDLLAALIEAIAPEAEAATNECAGDNRVRGRPSKEDTVATVEAPLAQ
jgi:hypothetical protein